MTKPAAPSGPGPLMADKAASIFRIHDLDGKAHLTFGGMNTALAEMTVLHGMPSSAMSEVLASDRASDNRDKMYSLADFLALNERLHALHVKAARGERLYSSGHAPLPPPGSDSSLALKQCFSKYCHMPLGVGRSMMSDVAPALNAAQLHKLCQDIGIAGERADLLHQASVDIVFTKCKSSGSRRLNYQQWLQALCVLSEETGYDLFDVISSAELNFAQTTSQKETGHDLFDVISSTELNFAQTTAQKAYETGYDLFDFISSAELNFAQTTAQKDDPFRQKSPPNGNIHFQRFGTSFIPRMQSEGFPGNLPSSTTHQSRPVTAVVPARASSGAPLKPSNRAQSTRTPSTNQANPRLTKSAIGPVSSGRPGRPDVFQKSESLKTKDTALSHGFDVMDGMSPDQLPIWMSQVSERLDSLESKSEGSGGLPSLTALPTPALAGITDASLAAKIQQLVDLAMEDRLSALEGSAKEHGKSIQKVQDTFSLVDSARGSQVESLQRQVTSLELSLDNAHKSHGDSLKGQVQRLEEQLASQKTDALAAAMASASSFNSTGEQTSAVFAQLESKLQEVDRQMAAQAKSVSSLQQQARQLAESQANLEERSQVQSQDQAKGESSLKAVEAKVKALAKPDSAVEEVKVELVAQKKKLASLASTVSSDGMQYEPDRAVEEVKVELAAPKQKLSSLASTVSSEGMQYGLNTSHAVWGTGGKAELTVQQEKLSSMASSVSSEGTQPDSAVGKVEAELTAQKQKLSSLASSVSLDGTQVNSAAQKRPSLASSVSSGGTQGLITTTSSEISNQLIGMKAEMKALTTQVSGLKTDVSEVSGLKTDVSEVRTDVAVLKLEMTALSTQLTEIRAKMKITQLKSDIAELEAEVQKSRKITKLKSDIAELEAEVQKSSSTVLAIRTEQRSQADSLKADIAKAQQGSAKGGGSGATDLALKNLTNRVDDLEGSIGQLVGVVQQVTSEAAKTDKQVTSEAAKTDKQVTSEAAKSEEQVTSEAAKSEQVTEVERLFTTRFQQISENLDECVASISKDAKKGNLNGLSLDGAVGEKQTTKFASWEALKHVETTLTMTCANIRDSVDAIDNRQMESSDQMEQLEAVTMESLELKDKIITRVVRQLDSLEDVVEQLQDMNADD
eukprot:gene15540-21632_t